MPDAGIIVDIEVVTGEESDFARMSERLDALEVTLGHRPGTVKADCVFRESWALISRDLGHAFHAIVGSHFADAGRLADGFMESGLIGSVKRFRDAGPASQAFS